MSHQPKTIGTKEEAKPALVPKLRFPEFRGAEAWHVTTLDSVCEVLNNRRKPITGNDRTPGPYPYYGASGIVDYVGDFIFDERLLLVGEDGAKWGAFEQTAFIAEGKYWVNNHAHVLKPFAASDTLLENYLTMRDLSPFVTGAAPPKLTLGKLKGIPVPLPRKPAEQQKIAECLSSVDELIAAQARKVDALKTHKKGLMQQLFPREGETQPRLRFPEFQNAGEWEQKPLGGLCRIRTGKKDANEGAADGVYPFFTCAEKHIYCHSYSFDAEAILVAGNANVGQTSYYNGKFEAYQRTYVLTDFKGMFVPYLYSVLDANLRPDLLAQVQTSAMSYIRLPMLEEYQINSPSSQAEQQRIASCLSSLDALITAEMQKLESLKTHKKGLMQQLFPSPEDG